MADPIKALRRIQYEAVSLADAQVIAMEALAAQEQAEPVKHEPVTLPDVLDALNCFNKPRPSEGDDPWTESDFISVRHLPDFINIIAAAWFSHPAAQPESAPDNADSALLARAVFAENEAAELRMLVERMTSAKPLAAPARLIGWRTENYLHETADPAKAKNWEPNIGVLPIFEGDPNTKLAAPAAPAAPAQPQVQAQPLTDEQIKWLIPAADGSAEANVQRVEVLPGVMGPEFDEVDAWSRPLVLQVVRASISEFCRANGIGQPAGKGVAE